jgi:hypothetical protein
MTTSPRDTLETPTENSGIVCGQPDPGAASVTSGGHQHRRVEGPKVAWLNKPHRIQPAINDAVSSVAQSTARLSYGRPNV